MGVTVLCRKTGRSIDLGYFGFKRLRDKVAELYGGVFWDHYQGIDKAPFMGEARKQYFDAFDKRTEELIREKKVSVKIVDFLLQPDVGGSIHYGACKEILKVILTDCAVHKCDMVWR